MQYVRLGRAGVKVSRIALGLGFRGQSSADQAQTVIERAIDLGLNFIDCANFYGLAGGASSEELLGRVLKTKRDQVVITSKVSGTMGTGPNDQGSCRVHILAQVEQSLRRLGTDRIDVYFLHSFDDQTPLEETIRTMDDLVRSGKIRYVGCCNFTAWQVCKSLWVADNLRAEPFICVQNPYSLLDRSLEAEMFGFIRDQGIGMMSFSPLGTGLLSGVYVPGEAPSSGTLWAAKNRARYDRSLSGKAPAILSALRDIASERGKTPTQVALNWVISKPEVTVAISGSDTVEQLEENLDTLGWELTQEEIVRLDSASTGTRVEFTDLV